MTQKLKDFLSQHNINKNKVLVVSCLVVALVFVSFFTPLYDIREINVAGNSTIDADVLVRASGIKVGENIFEADIASAKKRISKVAYVDTAKVKRILPNKIRINVKEGEVYAYINFIGNYIGIDHSGKILDIKQQIGEVTKPVVYGVTVTKFEIGSPVEIDNKEAKTVLFEMLGQIKSSEVEDSILYMDINDFENITFTLHNKVSVKLGSTDSIKYKIAYLKSVLEQLGDVSGGIIDITDTENVTYKAN